MSLHPVLAEKLSAAGDTVALLSRVAPVGCQLWPPVVLLKTPPPWVPA